jgi:hypothetical protein
VKGSDECFVETGEGRPVDGAFVATAEEGRFSSLWWDNWDLVVKKVG